MATLTQLLQQSTDYPNYHPKVQQIFTKMATAFDKNPDHIALNTTELTQLYIDTSHEQWRSFLSLPVVDRYFRSLMKFNSQIAFRKSLDALTREAAQGNTQAAKQITDISSILDQEQSNKTVVLTYVPRQPHTSPLAHPADRTLNHPPATTTFDIYGEDETDNDEPTDTK